MLDEIILLITNCVSSALFWFLDFLDAIPGSATLIITAFLISCVVRFLIAPFIGAASSDFARYRVDNVKRNISYRQTYRQAQRAKRSNQNKSITKV